MLHAGSDGRKVTLQVVGTAVVTVGNIFNRNIVINKIFSPPFFISMTQVLAVKWGNSIAHIFYMVREMMFSKDRFVTHFEKFAFCFTAEFACTVSMYPEFLRKFLPSAVALKVLLVCKSMYQSWSIFSSSTEKFKQDCSYQLSIK